MLIVEGYNRSGSDQLQTRRGDNPPFCIHYRRQQAGLALHPPGEGALPWAAGLDTLHDTVTVQWL